MLCASQDDTSEQDAAKAELQKAMESFIKGMLTNHSQLPLQGIHNKLTMFSAAPRALAAAAAVAASDICLTSPACLAVLFGCDLCPRRSHRSCVSWNASAVVDPAYDHSEAELRVFLDRLVSDDVLDLRAGSYSLR